MPTISIKPRLRGITLSEISEKKCKVLIRRNVGGLGDILMHRMIFEDFKLLMPEVEITFACPVLYHPAVLDHPFIDNLVNCKQIKDTDFLVQYDTSYACNRYELKAAPFCDKHRSDIWAEHCGVSLTCHNMHIKMFEGELAWAKGKIRSDKPTVLVSPISAMENKNLAPHQINPVIEKLSKDYFVFTTHTSPTYEIDAPCFTGLSIREWMSLIASVDYVISVDSAAFHCAGGMGKPVVGIFGWADGMVYGKHYPKAVLVQKHRDYTPGWTCGPCFNFMKCPKCSDVRKPCITELTSDDILMGFSEMADKYHHAKRIETIDCS